MKSNKHAYQIVKPALITISGNPGSGKSTAATKLCQLLQGEQIYVGQIRRDMAKEKGMSLEQFNEYSIGRPECDVDVDIVAAAKARELYSQGKSVIVEGRTQFHFIPESVKLYIFVEPEEGARRILAALQDKNQASTRNEASADDLSTKVLQVIKREETDAQRYVGLYGFDHRDRRHYDRVIDSTKLSPEEVVEQALQYISEKQAILV